PSRSPGNRRKSNPQSPLRMRPIKRSSMEAGEERQKSSLQRHALEGYPIHREQRRYTWKLESNVLANVPVHYTYAQKKTQLKIYKYLYFTHVYVNKKTDEICKFSVYVT